MTGDELYNKFLEHESMYRSYAFKLTDNIHDANDLIQTSLLNALKGIYNEESNFKSWFHTIIRNAYITQYRRDKKKVDKYEMLDFKHPKYLMKTFSDENINSIINKYLSEREKSFVSLLYIGYKQKEIAQILGISRNTLVSLIYRMRTRLKNTNIINELSE